MKPSPELDMYCVEKILKYIKNIRQAYATYNIFRAHELATNELCHFAITQIITNIYETKIKLTDDALAQIPKFAKIRLRTARNIASHDYDSVDFDIVYRITLQLTSNEVVKELEAIVAFKQ